ncbi:toll/interleukin-1 receptor domain-containing protein [Xanthobacter aminoxidans]|uniref:toll/interleukin-1 receptor domain-containing protein n=1 Tax=Xanthobacter aminoxidans TaxID=186280 RepID=UPI00372BB621
MLKAALAAAFWYGNSERLELIAIRVNEPMADNPKLFISYSWTSPAHEDWVLTLAKELVSHGVDVIIDKWNLKPGYDANAFMESMVTDKAVNKVLIICDAKYAEKSDARAGGAGAEAQIITPQLYNRRDQDKFAAVVTQKNEDGAPFIPTYYKGRIFFDLSDDAKYAQEFERLIRWVWDKPADVRPVLGKMPSFLADDVSSIKMATSVPFRRAYDAIRSGNKNAESAVSDYFRIFASELNLFRIQFNAEDVEPFDEKVVKNISNFLSYRNEMIEIFTSIALYRPTTECIRAVHRFFELIVCYFERPVNITSWREDDFDNFRFIVQELFLYAVSIMIKYEKFDLAAYLIDEEYFTIHNRESPMQPFTILYDNLHSFGERNRRLERLSARADLLRDRCHGVNMEFRYLMMADFVLFLRGCGSGFAIGWWPDTLVFAGRYPEPMEIFARSKSASYFEKIAPMLGVRNKGELQMLLSNLDPRTFMGSRLNRIDFLQLARISELATAP